MAFTAYRHGQTQGSARGNQVQDVTNTISPKVAVLGSIQEVGVVLQSLSSIDCVITKANFQIHSLYHPVKSQDSIYGIDVLV